MSLFLAVHLHACLHPSPKNRPFAQRSKLFSGVDLAAMNSLDEIMRLRYRSSCVITTEITKQVEVGLIGAREAHKKFPLALNSDSALERWTR